MRRTEFITLKSLGRDLLRHGLVAAVVVAIVCSLRKKIELSNSSPEERNAVEHLVKADYFTLGPECVGGDSREVVDFWMLLKSKNAKEHFTEIFQRGTPEAKMYALAGLQQVSHWRFLKCADAFRENKDARVVAGMDIYSPDQLLKYLFTGEVDRAIKYSGPPLSDADRKRSHFRHEINSKLVSIIDQDLQ